MARWTVAAKLEDELARRRRYREALVERRADGSMGGKDARKLERALLERVHPVAPLLDVIREKCLDCCCYQASEVDKCTAVACSLWPYRFGSNPFSNRRGNVAALLRARKAPVSSMSAAGAGPSVESGASRSPTLEERETPRPPAYGL